MFTKEEIDKKRSYIQKCVIKSGVTSDLKGNEIDLSELKDLYDKYFFANRIQKLLGKTNSTLNFVFSSYTKTGGSCSKKGSDYIIKIPIVLFQNLFQKGEKNLLVNGILCANKLECLQIVFEHELIHLLMFLYYYDNKPSYGQPTDTFNSHGELFRSMTYMYFCHTDHKHSLFNGEASDKIKKEDIILGLRIKYQSKDGNEYHGNVSKINPKSAKIVLDDGEIFCVPYTMLERSDKPVSEVPLQVNSPSSSEKDLYFVGMRVNFFRKGAYFYGTISCKNPNTATIVLDNGLDMVVPYYRLLKTNLPPSENIQRNIKHDLRIGDIVNVKFKGGRISKGSIVKLNPSTARTKLEDGIVWNIYYQNILNKVQK